ALAGPSAADQIVRAAHGHADVTVTQVGRASRIGTDAVALNRVAVTGDEETCLIAGDDVASPGCTDDGARRGAIHADRDVIRARPGGGRIETDNVGEQAVRRLPRGGAGEVDTDAAVARDDVAGALLADLVAGRCARDQDAGHVRGSVAIRVQADLIAQN